MEGKVVGGGVGLLVRGACCALRWRVVRVAAVATSWNRQGHKWGVAGGCFLAPHRPCCVCAATETLDPLKLLQDDLKDDDYEQGIRSIKRLTTVALALGPVRTRTELLPFLLESETRTTTRH